MSKIKQLSALEAQKIAAGEVVERPANVVKELIENALDAGASAITLYIEDAGKKLIRCVDNGSGMSREDARNCILHHATSKITSVADLDSLATFGFRGEALSSIASVSHLSITTKEAASESGVRLDISQGTIEKESIVATNTGTDIALTDLFFNIPARKKFLKTRETEWRAIVQLFQAFCLAYPEVSFKLHHDERLIYNNPAATSLIARMGQLFEPSLVKNLLENSQMHEKFDIRCTVAFTLPMYTRFDRTQLFVFVNKRWVKNYKLSQAFIKGYTNMLPPSKYPAGCIFITVDQQSLDVNIHPRKEEVQFSHPRRIEDLIESTVQKKLEEYHSQQLGETSPQLSTPSWPTTHTPQELSSFPFSYNVIPSKKDQLDHPHNEKAFLAILNSQFTSVPSQNLDTQKQSVDFPTTTIESKTSSDQSLHLRSLSSIKDNISFILPEAQQNGITALTSQESGAQNRVQQTVPLKNMTIPDENKSVETMQYRLLGQFALTYILIETEKGLVLIDQHAAHERILYERFSATFDNPTRIALIVPQIITLTKEDLLLFEPHLPLLSSFGIDAHCISDHELSIQETSIYFKNRSVEECVKQAISVLHEHSSMKPDELKKIIHERLHASMSCKAAIRAGDTLSIEGMNGLIKELATTKNRLSCPHGRPTIWELTIPEIEKKFKRDYR